MHVVRRLALEDPNHRNEWQLKEIRAFMDAAVRMATREDREVALRSQPSRHTMQVDDSHSRLTLLRHVCDVGGI